MKHWLVWFSWIVLLGCAGGERTALPPLAPRACDGAVVRSAADLDGLAGCTHVRGDLVIAAKDVVDLRPLASLWSVSGTLAVQGCARLESLRGLERLHTVGHLVVVGNPALQRLRGLDLLQGADGVSVVDNPRLRDLRGLERLEHLDGVALVGNGLVTLRGLEQLESVGDLVIADHPRLIDVSALSRLRSTENLALERTPMLAPRLGFFARLERVSGSLVLSESGGVSESEVQYLKERQQVPVREGIFVGRSTW